jgi:hypothetical protein
MMFTSRVGENPFTACPVDCCRQRLDLAERAHAGTQVVRPE